MKEHSSGLYTDFWLFWVIQFFESDGTIKGKKIKVITICLDERDNGLILDKAQK